MVCRNKHLSLSIERWHRLRPCGLTGSPCTHMPICPSASSRSGASPPPSCPQPPASWPCFRNLWLHLMRSVMCMWAWITLPCPKTRWLWPNGRDGYIATSRVTAHSPIATCSHWGFQPLAGWVPSTARMPKRWRNTTTILTRAVFL